MGVLLLTLPSCSDDDENQPSRTQLLTESTWVFNEAVHADLETELLITLLFDDTEVKFVDDGSYSTYDPISKDWDFGTWEFTNSEGTIVMDKNTQDESSADVITLDANNLRLKYNSLEYGNFELIFKH